MFTKLSTIRNLSSDLPDITINEYPGQINEYPGQMNEYPGQINETQNNYIRQLQTDPYVMFTQRQTADTQLYTNLIKERELEQKIKRLEELERTNSMSMIDQYVSRQIEHMKYKEPHVSKNEPTCVEISKHIEDCPVCSKLYNQKTKETVYVKEENCEDCSKWKNWCIILAGICIVLFLIILKIYLFK
jgi:hypothetical protein